MVTAKKLEQMGTPKFRIFVVKLLLSRHAKKASGFL